jgi:hypothetical protein
MFSAGCTMNIGSKKLLREVASTFCGAQGLATATIRQNPGVSRALSDPGGAKWPAATSLAEVTSTPEIMILASLSHVVALAGMMMKMIASLDSVTNRYMVNLCKAANP